MEFLPLHSNPEYLEECADLLNEEWKRSRTARLHSLGKSKDAFPICLVMIKTDVQDKKFVVGSSRLSDVQGQTLKSCIVESVVVKKSKRGKGYGRVLMEKTEEFAVSKGYKVMYLTTHDKQDFYKHLGYEFCTPVVSIATDILPDHLTKKLMGSLGMNNADEIDEKLPTTNPPDPAPPISGQPSSTATPPPPPSLPAPPPAPPLPDQGSCSIPPGDVSAPAVPPPAPPRVPTPAPPPPVIAQTTNLPPDLKSLKLDDSESNVRWDPSKVSWMKKVL